MNININIGVGTRGLAGGLGCVFSTNIKRVRGVVAEVCSFIVSIDITLNDLHIKYIIIMILID